MTLIIVNNRSMGVSRGEVVGMKVKEIIGQRGWSLGTLAARSGLDKGYLSQLTRGMVKNPGVGTLGKLSDALGVDVWYLTGERPMPKRQPTVVEGVVVLPVMKMRVQASGAPAWDETQETATTLARLAFGRADRLIAAVVTGTCMVPHVNPGDVVILDPAMKSPQDGQMVVLADAEGATLVKWYRVDQLGRPFLRAEDGTELRPNDARIIGTVIDISRRPIRDPQAGFHSPR